MLMTHTLDLYFGGKGSGCNPDAGNCGRKPVGGVGSTHLTNTEAFKDPVNKSFIVTSGGKVHGTAAPQAHDTLLIFYQPHFKDSVIAGKHVSASDKFLQSGGIEASIRMPGIHDKNTGYMIDDRFGHVAIGKATPEVLKRLVQVIDNLDADQIELQIGKEFYSGPKAQVRAAVRLTLEKANNKAA